MLGVQNHRRVGTIINLHIEENQVTLPLRMENPRIGKILCPNMTRSSMIPAAIPLKRFLLICSLVLLRGLLVLCHGLGLLVVGHRSSGRSRGHATRNSDHGTVGTELGLLVARAAEGQEAKGADKKRRA